jgi:charged multivesicular body protein 5
MLELDALGDDLNFEEEEVPSYLQDDVEVPSGLHSDNAEVSCCEFEARVLIPDLTNRGLQGNVQVDEFGLPISAEAPMKA